ncbi:MAG: hypothetical protein E6J34_22860 [Chloroflexi bacterium]|nr:MAG: hypothetical protein E6J34_22860 [Chloroflexota bacterium]
MEVLNMIEHVGQQAGRVGQQFGNYRLLRLVGEGGFSEVYLAKHIHLDAQVAIKIFHDELMAQQRDAFLHEARTIATLEHPSIIKVLDCGIERNASYLIMNYALGGTLRQRHPRGTRVTEQEVVSYINQVSAALQHIHDHHLIHRDVKPGNMLLGDHDEVLLSDFGTAMSATATIADTKKAVAGTGAYLAPEQIMGKPCHASDQYSLAVVAYEWLTGNRPFHGTFSELCTKHLSAPPPPLREKNPAVAPRVEAVIMKALAKDAAQRFNSVQDFAIALAESIQPATVSTQSAARADTEQQTGTQIVSDQPVEVADASSAQQSASEQALVETGDADGIVLADAPSQEQQTRAQTGKAIAILSKALVPVTQVSQGKDEQKKLLILLTVSLTLLLIGGGVGYALPRFHAASPIPQTVIPTGSALAATITIIPKHRVWLQNYQMLAIFGTPSAAKQQVQARSVSVTTQPQAQTVQATGTEILPGTAKQATGTLLFTNTSAQPISFTQGTVLRGQVPLVLDETITLPASTPTQPAVQASVPAHAEHPGKAGNITLGQFTISGSALGSATLTWNATNATAFTGGTDGQTALVVSRDDIDGATNSLLQNNTPDASSLLQTKLTEHEKLLNSAQCKATSTANHHANDQASSVTVTAFFTCTGIAYDEAGATATARNLLAQSMHAANYAQADPANVSVTQALTDTQGNVALTVQASDNGIYQFNDEQKVVLTKQIVGKNKRIARALLLSQEGVGSVTINLGDDRSNTLPTDARRISIAIIN